MSREKVRQRQIELITERERLNEGLSTTDDQLRVGAQRLFTAMAGVLDVLRFYRDSPDVVREQVDRTLFEQLFLDDDPTRVAEVVKPHRLTN